MKNFDLATYPMVAVWETTRTKAPFPGDIPPNWEPRELSATEAEKLIRDVAKLRVPVFVFAGANPLTRPEIASLVRYASSCGLRPSMVLSDSPLLTRKAIKELKSAGLARLGLTLQASSAPLHEDMSAVQGSFARTIQAMRWANECRVPLQIHTEVCRSNVDDLENMASLLKNFRMLIWSLSFPVPAHRSHAGEAFTADEFEEIFERIYDIAQSVPFKIKTVEADHYRRYVTQRRTLFRLDKSGAIDSPFRQEGIPGVLPLHEGRASVFITSSGEVFPNRHIPVSAGNIRHEELREIYRHSHLFRSFRDTANLKGKCGRCEFKEMCGGSRARAWALAGDMFAGEENCAYQPGLASKAG
jgi:radical SAM protein with 4Fe4S-binding SPASM domain